MNIFLRRPINALWSSYVQQLTTPDNAIETGVKRFRQIFIKIYKNISGPFRPLWVLWPLRLKTHFLLCTSLYLLNQKTYFAIFIRFFCGVWGYANQLFRLNFDHFTAFWKIKFSKNIKSKFLGCRFFRNFSYIFFENLKVS